MSASRTRTLARRARHATGLALVLAAACSRPSETPAAPAPDVAATAATVRPAAHPITGAATDYDPLLALVGDARVVLLGESTHGTREYYRERMRITQRLVRERGFTAVAIEGDWPETFRVNEYVRGRGTDASPEAALSGFARFPRWMWANAEVRELVAWLRAHNDAQPESRDVGVYGLDVYSLEPSARAVERYLDQASPATAAWARARYACFAPFGGDAQRYGASAGGGGTSCQGAAAAVLDTMRARAAVRPADPAAAEALFAALRNAHSVANAEEYFRVLHAGRESSWNARDRRMSEGLQDVERHVGAITGQPGRVVMWAHNTHVGDARHTEPGTQGELNIGQLTRERLGAQAVNVGFLTHRGTVLAAPEWDAPGRVWTLRPALAGSFADLLHAVGAASGPRDFLLTFRAGAVADTLARERLERAVGVVYAPGTERQSHYFRARLSRQFDAVVFLDVTSAVTPLGER